jgi:hypothetical protein
LCAGVAVMAVSFVESGSVTGIDERVGIRHRRPMTDAVRGRQYSRDVD